MVSQRVACLGKTKTLVAEMRFVARRNGWLLRRILRRLVKVRVCDLEIMFRGDQLTVAEPRGDDVKRIDFGQFRFASAAKVLKQFWPGLQSGSFHSSRNVDLHER